jgi:hypothetical protein
MTLLGFKTILHKKCRSGKNSEGPAENSNFKKSANVTKKWRTMSAGLQMENKQMIYLYPFCEWLIVV